MVTLYRLKMWNLLNFGLRKRLKKNVLNPPQSRTLRILRFYVMFLFMWQTLFRVSDAGMSLLFVYLAMLLVLVLSTVENPDVQDFIQILPRSCLAAKKLIGIAGVPFSKYVTCPKCHSLYSIDSFKITLPDKTITSRFCSHVNFPHHPHLLRRSPCNTQLMKTIRTSAGTTSLYPRQLYCYQSISSFLKAQLLQTSFFEQTELWTK